jgi:hypothetical protein
MSARIPCIGAIPIAFVLLLGVCGETVLGAPPPLGPTAPLRPGYRSLGVSFFHDQVDRQVDEALVNANRQIDSSGDAKADLTLTETERYVYSSATRREARPNENYIHFSYHFALKLDNIEFKVTGDEPEPDGPVTGGYWQSYPWSRKLTFNVELGVYCDDWHSPDGKILVRSDVSSVHLEEDRSITGHL